jgi:hypothetical protein
MSASVNTPTLRAAFPDLQHHLFEPVSAHFPSIRKNYAAVPHVLHPIAVSNVDGEAFLNTFAIGVRLQPFHLKALDAWIKKQTPPVTRPEAIRGMIETVLHILSKDTSREAVHGLAKKQKIIRQRPSGRRQRSYACRVRCTCSPTTSRA